MLNIVIGAVDIPLRDIFDIMTGGHDTKSGWRYIIMESRLPKAMAALLCGGALSLCGLLLQTVFRNPLADPSVFGISGGAGLGVALVMLCGGGSAVSSMLGLSETLTVLLAAFAGAMVVTFIIFLVSLKVGSNILLIVIGIILGYVTSSIITMLNFFASRDGVRSYVIWGMGDFGNVPMMLIPVFVLIVVVCSVVSLAMVKQFNIFMLGDWYARNLGVATKRLRNVVLVMAGLLTSTTTAFCGPISFIGLSVPHMSRLMMRTDDFKILLPTTILLGSIVALTCNVLCVLPDDGGAIPLNAMTPLIGAPVIIYVIMRGLNGGNLK
ncbi:MAG: iron chelate uptake ABC transporter family permease subunit [Prevotella sp.]